METQPSASEFTYQEPFPHGEKPVEYRLVTSDHVSVARFEGNEILKIDPEGLVRLTNEALRDVSFLLRPAHQRQVAAILDDPEASENDRYVALAMLMNSMISARFELPFCQDTGTATVVARKGQRVWTGVDDAWFISKGVHKTYTEENLRYSQTVPLSMYEEQNSGNNLPAQIDIYAGEGMEYRFLVFVVGGTSAEACMKTVKLASAGYHDTLPTTGNVGGRAFRDLELEAQLLHAAHTIGFGAQFGGKYFAHDVRVIRLPRHGASCPVGMGVSCSADRNILAKIDARGLWVEEMERHPERLIPERYRGRHEVAGVKVDLNRPMKEILETLSRHGVSTQLSLTGKLIVARDIAHAKLKERLDRGEDLPRYFKDHPVYYAGPAKTPPGKPAGSFGPTTAGRMDSYVDLFQSRGGSMIMIAKGNRSPQVTEACKKHGGFYLGSIGGPAALLAEKSIKKVEVVEYPELGMEAIWAIDVVDFPAFILVDDKGNDFFRR
ncbi:MAG: fumarate hydratase C-terminal domain-containing protein [Candidatus Riflebacteria bacterium]|nr:fumarate hydratase C-terminal domain-containing protein [Candidatus Riflebacteria bacterium]